MDWIQLQANNGIIDPSYQEFSDAIFHRVGQIRGAGH